MSETKKYYWLKLKKDFFKRHDIRIIESMENGETYALFYLKLLVESISHEGKLRFSDTIPYNDKMLATITNTNIDIVRSAINIFSELKMLDILDDDTIYMNQIQEMIGGETEWAEKKRLYREKQKQLPKTTEGQKKDMSDKSKSLDKELEKDIYINILNHWNDKNIYTHDEKTFKKYFMKKHKDLIELHSLQVVIKAIDNYSEVYKSDKYYYSHRFSLWDFITRSLDKFVDNADPFNNFIDFKHKQENNNTTPQIKTRQCNNCGTVLTTDNTSGLCWKCEE